MTALYLHQHAKDDLETLWESEPHVAARITIFLEELKGDEGLLDCLTDHHFGDDKTEAFSVSKWQRVYRQGMDLWRVKLWDLEALGLRYRMVYAYYPTQTNYYVLAIAPRDFDYDPTTPIGKRILSDYQELL